jgi:hypothetical protein
VSYFDPSKSILVGVDPATLQQWLADAQAAYAALMSGRREIVVSYDGKSVTYQASNIQALTSWIQLLMAQLGLSCGRRAIRPYFR